jgi:hypothetical protein
VTTVLPWHDSRLISSPTSHHFTIGGHSVLFCEKRQKLFGLNATAEFIWRHFAEGRTPAEVCRQLADMGVADADAAGFVQTATMSWMTDGQLTPRDVVDLLAQAANETRYLRIQDLTARLDFRGNASAEAFDHVFGHFGTGALVPTLTLSVVGFQHQYFMFEENSPVAWCTADELIPQLKAVLTERYVSSVGNSFLVHAAFLVAGNRGLLICGEPGAGKTTLCVALNGSGYEYCADDIVRIGQDGMATGVPFAPAVKSGSWPIVSPYAPGILNSPTFRRGDGQDVRYLPTRTSSCPPRVINDVLLLARQPGVPVALETVEPLEMVSTLLESAFSTKSAIEAGALKAFARTIEAAGCYRLIYSDLGDAVRAIRRLSDE